MSKTVRIVCRIGAGQKVPCNWAKDGYCGADGKKCVILNFMEG